MLFRSRVIYSFFKFSSCAIYFRQTGEVAIKEYITRECHCQWTKPIVSRIGGYVVGTVGNGCLSVE